MGDPYRSNYLSYDAWVESPVMEPMLVERRTRGGFATKMYLFRQDQACSDPPVPDLTIQMCTRGQLQLEGNLGFDRFSRRVHAGSFCVTAPNRPIELSSEPSRFELMILAMPWRQLSKSIQESIDQDLNHLSGALHSDVHTDPMIAQLITMLWNQVISDRPESELTTQGIETAIIGRLLQMSRMLSDKEDRRGKLSAKQLAVVLDIMQAGIESGVELSDLASSIGVSRFHFARLFKRTTGESPGQYLIKLRVERAKLLLLETRDQETTLSMIAALCGFSDQAHMTRQFRKYVGITPGNFRNTSNAR